MIPQYRHLTTRDLLQDLGELTVNASFTDRLKIKFRPFICPFDLVLNAIPSGQRILDIGCGSGQFLYLLAKHCNPSHIAGIEISDRLIQNAQQLFSNSFAKSKFTTDFRVFDGTHFPDSVSKADYIFLIDVFHHVPKEQHADYFDRLFQAMSPGSTLVFKDIDASSPLVMANKLHDAVFASEIGNEIRFDIACDKLIKAGFTLVSTRTLRLYVYPHYFIMAQKQ